ncbi:hypothetical protein Tco_0821834 [Tanacetum coccineum]|uniref:Uncharacterized protein n=1 Tax=Tanacetum coccineum TaxID=301880 RepID=A0ABQ5ADD1_9ASTR
MNNLPEEAIVECSEERNAGNRKRAERKRSLHNADTGENHFSKGGRACQRVYSSVQGIKKAHDAQDKATEEEVVNTSGYADNEVNSPPSNNSPHFKHSHHSKQHIELPSPGGGVYSGGTNVDAQIHPSEYGGWIFSSSFEGFGRNAFLGRNTDGDKGGSLQGHISSPMPFFTSLGLTTGSSLNDAESCRDMMINLATPTTHLACAGRETALSEQVGAVEIEKDDLLDKNNGQKEKIKELEEALAAKTAALSEAKQVAAQAKRDLERLPVNLTDEWSEWVNVDRTDEEVQAILATATDYDLDCRSTFQSSFEDLFTKSYPFVEKLTEALRQPLGDLQNIWPDGKGPTIGVGASGN